MTIHIDHHAATISLSGPKNGYKIVGTGTDGYQESITGFLESQPVYTYRYRPEVVDYYLLSGDGVGTNMSFCVVNQQDQIMALCPLILSQGVSGVVGAYSGTGWLPTPLFHSGLSDKQCRAWEKVVFERAAEILTANNASRWMVEGEAMTLGTGLLEDAFPSRFNFMDASSLHHIMDLRPEPEEIWRTIRHSAQHEINLGNRNYNFLFHDQETFTNEIGEKYREMHRLSAGRVTRSAESFQRMYEWVREGLATFVEQKVGDKTINITVVGYGEKTACPMSTADDPSIVPPSPLRHVMLWNICMECRKRGIEFFEVGETHMRDDIHHIWSDKEKNIASFKRAFGDASTPLKRWIWFKDKSEELRYYEDRLSQLKMHWREN